MCCVIDLFDALRIAAATATALTGVGLSIAWLPAFRQVGAAAFTSRLLVTAGLVVAMLDLGGLGGVLGLALAAMGVAAMWGSPPAPAISPPPRQGVVVA